MAASIQTLRRIAELGLSSHKQIVDAYIAVGYDLDKIAIVKGFYQPDARDVLHGYGFKLGSDWGDESDDRGRFKNLPQKLVNEYVECYFPGLDEEGKGKDITLEMFLNVYYPDWRNMTEDSHPGILGRKLTHEEKRILEGKDPDEIHIIRRKGK